MLIAFIALEMSAINTWKQFYAKTNGLNITMYLWRGSSTRLRATVCNVCKHVIFSRDYTLVLVCSENTIETHDIFI
jgi:uncharacterized CHY-type Zn-finger protein